MGDPIRSDAARTFAQLPAFTPARKPATGELFAREVERAAERARGEAAGERRAEELASRKREARRASFGRERDTDEPTERNGPRSEVRASEAVFRSADAPVAARLATDAHAMDEDGGPPQTARAPQASADGTAGAAAKAGIDPAAVTATHTAPAPAAGTLPALARPAAVDALAGAAPRVEAPTGDTAGLARTQAATPRGSERAVTSEAPAPSDPGVLERAGEILKQIKLHLATGVRRLTLDLEPVELGRMAIQLALRGGKVHGIVRAERAETLELLKAREPELVALLAERGVDADAVRFELGFGGSRGHGGAPSGPSTPSAPRTNTEGAPRAPELATTEPPRRGDALVDLYA